MYLRQHPDAPTSRGHRLEALDGVRFFAALWVVVFHFAAADRGTWKRPTRFMFGWLFDFGTYGWLGVELFFMISGFVICMSTWGKPLRSFVVSRVIRLYPAYWAAVALTALVVAFDRSMATPVTWPKLLDNLTLTEGFSRTTYVDPSFWTLTIELAFYAIFGVTVAWRGLSYRRVVVFCVVWMAVAFAMTWWQPMWLGLIVQPLYTPFFVAGMVMYLMHRFGPDRILWGLLAISYAFCVFRLDGRTFAQHRRGWFMNYGVAVAIVTVFFAVLLMIALGMATKVRGRWLVVAGGLTYPVYLIHQQIGETVLRSLLPYISPWPLIILMFVFVFALAYALRRWVEKPLAPRLKALLTSAVDIRPPIRATDQQTSLVGQHVISPRSESDPSFALSGGEAGLQQLDFERDLHT